jgi:hypothetical protein
MEKTQKRLMTLTIIFLVGISIFFLREIIINFNLINQSKKAFSEIKAEDFTKITVEGEDFTEKLEKKDGQWIVLKENKKYPADQAKVNNIIESITTFEKSELISENKKRHKELGIDKKKIIFKAGDESYTVFIGEESSRSDNFVRLNDEDKVYAFDGFHNVFVPEGYRDMTVPFVKNETDVNAIKINHWKDIIELKKDNGQWMWNDEKIDRSEMSFYLNELAVIKADAILEDNPVESNGLTPEITITVQEGKNNKVLKFYKKDEETYYAKRDNSDIVYEVNASLAKSLNKTKEDLVQKEE